VKYTFIQLQAQDYPIQTLCRVLGVSPSGYYDWRDRPMSARERANQGLLAEIKDIHVESKERYGSPRIHAELKERGQGVGRKRVERLMSLHDIVAQRSKRHRRTYTHRETQVAEKNHLDREFDASGPNEKWVAI